MSNIKPIILAVTTINNDAEKAVAYFSQFAHVGCHVYVSHQITNSVSTPLSSISTPFVHYTSHYWVGLSANRNALLDLVDEWIFIICDDDCLLEENFEEIIKDAYSNNKASVITFQTFGKNWLRKVYKKHWFAHGYLSILSVSSTEITFDIAAVKEYRLRFDEGFGLWTTYPSWEENIFLHDCMRAGLSLQYVPNAINSHVNESSGYISSDYAVKQKVFKRMYGSFLSYLLVGILYIYKNVIWK